MEPGQPFDLHWSAGEPATPDLPTRRVTLRAELAGPYRDPFLKVADGDVRTVAAPDITADTLEAQKPVSSMLLPTDLPDGLFLLRLSMLIAPDSETGTGTMGVVSESMSVIRVGQSVPG